MDQWELICVGFWPWPLLRAHKHKIGSARGIDLVFVSPQTPATRRGLTRLARQPFPMLPILSQMAHHL